MSVKIANVIKCFRQEAQLPQRNSVSAIQVSSMLAEWSCNSLNTADVVQL